MPNLPGKIALALFLLGLSLIMLAIQSSLAVPVLEVSAAIIVVVYLAYFHKEIAQYASRLFIKNTRQSSHANSGKPDDGDWYEDFAEKIQRRMIHGALKEQANLMRRRMAAGVVKSLAPAWRVMRNHLNHNLDDAVTFAPDLAFCAAIATSHHKAAPLRDTLMYLKYLPDNKTLAIDWSFDRLRKAIGDEIATVTFHLPAPERLTDTGLAAAVLLRYAFWSKHLGIEMDPRHLKPLVTALGDQHIIQNVQLFFVNAPAAISQTSSEPMRQAFMDAIVDSEHFALCAN